MKCLFELFRGIAQKLPVLDHKKRLMFSTECISFSNEKLDFGSDVMPVTHLTSTIIHVQAIKVNQPNINPITDLKGTILGALG